jgi:bacteriocin-like protein
VTKPDEQKHVKKVIAKAQSDPAFKQKLLSGELSDEELEKVSGGVGWAGLEGTDEEIAAALNVTAEVVRKRRQIARGY